MERLTNISEITELPMPCKMQESCGEDGCGDICGKYSEELCVGCPVQECMSKLSSYEDTGLEPEEVEQLKKDVDHWRKEAIQAVAKLGEIQIYIASLSGKKGPDEQM